MLERNSLNRASQDGSPQFSICRKNGSAGYCIHNQNLNAVTKQVYLPYPERRNPATNSDIHQYSQFLTIIALLTSWDRKRWLPQTCPHLTSLITSIFCMPFRRHDARWTFQRIMDIILSAVKWRSLWCIWTTKSSFHKLQTITSNLSAPRCR